MCRTVLSNPASQTIIILYKYGCAVTIWYALCPEWGTILERTGLLRSGVGTDGIPSGSLARCSACHFRSAKETQPDTWGCSESWTSGSLFFWNPNRVLVVFPFQFHLLLPPMKCVHAASHHLCNTSTNLLKSNRCRKHRVMLMTMQSK
jgi:hypothetical protein